MTIAKTIGLTWMVTTFVCGSSGSPTNEVVIRYKDSRPAQVELAADFTHWQAVPMQHDIDGTWSYRVSLSSGAYLYNLIVDGKRIRDPQNKRLKSFGDNWSNVLIVKRKRK